MMTQRGGVIPLVLCKRRYIVCTKDDEFDYQVLHLTDVFYKEYTNPPYIEILKKEKRSYNCLLIQSHYDYFICIPYRTEVNHNYAYKFKRSKRSKKHKSGLDYTKIVIIADSKFIESTTAEIDQDEYNETRDNINRIVQEATDFVDDYVELMNGKEIISSEEFKRRYQFSSLKYFHNELGIHNQK